MVSMEAQEQADSAARAVDPAWKPACAEVAVIRAGEQGQGGAVHNFCLDASGNVLACYGAGEIRVFSPEGQRVKTWKVETEPKAICARPDGTIFVGGGGRLLKLDAEGKVLAAEASPAAGLPVELSADARQMMGAATNQAEEVKRYTAMLASRRADVTGIAATDQDLFVACPSPSDFSYRVYRMDHNLQNAKLIVEGLRGCCGQMDIQARDGRLWIPHNARHRVECRDRDGKQLVSFGRQDRKAADGFGGCCEPKNLRLLANGDILTSESGPPVAIKRFSSEGKFLGVLGLPNYKSDCVRVTVDANADGSRVYILSTGDDTIHVLSPKKA